MDHAREDLDEGALACPVGAEQRMDLARLDGQVRRAERHDAAVSLREASDEQKWWSVAHERSTLERGGRALEQTPDLRSTTISSLLAWALAVQDVLLCVGGVRLDLHRRHEALR